MVSGEHRTSAWPLFPKDSDVAIACIESHFDQYGFGLWAVQIRNLVSFAGFVGLAVPSFVSRDKP